MVAIKTEIYTFQLLTLLTMRTQRSIPLDSLLDQIHFVH